jgi:hypothetical protein
VTDLKRLYLETSDVDRYKDDDCDHVDEEDEEEVSHADDGSM